MLYETRRARPVIAGRSPWLRGTLSVPGDPLVGSLALQLAAMARGESVIERLPETREVLSVVAALQALGAHCDKRAGRWHVQGLGVGGFLEPEAPVALAGGEADALLLGLVGLQDFPIRFTGLVHGPAVDAVLGVLRRSGAQISEGDGTVALRGPRFAAPLDLTLESGGLARAAMVLAGLAIAGVSRITAPTGPGHAERLIRLFGGRADMTASDTGESIEIVGLPTFRAQALVLPSDPALAAVPVLAALVTADSEVTVEAVLTDPARTGLLSALLAMGADVAVSNPRRLAGEDVADLTARHSALTAIAIAADHGLAAEDYAVLAVAAAFAEGESLLEGAGEGQRRLALTRALRVSGVHCEELPSGLKVRGARSVPGNARIPTRLDPRLAIAFLLMGMASAAPIEVDDITMVDEIFPDFLPLMEKLGASLTEKPA